MELLASDLSKLRRQKGKPKTQSVFREVGAVKPGQVQGGGEGLTVPSPPSNLTASSSASNSNTSIGIGDVKIEMAEEQEQETRDLRRWTGTNA